MREEFVLLVKSVDKKNRNINMYKLCLSSGVQRSYWFLCRCSAFYWFLFSVPFVLVQVCSVSFFFFSPVKVCSVPGSF